MCAEYQQTAEMLYWSDSRTQEGNKARRASSRSPNEFKTLKMAVMSILFLPPNLSVHILRAPPQFVAYATREVVKDLKYCLHYFYTCLHVVPPMALQLVIVTIIIDKV